MHIPVNEIRPFLQFVDLRDLDSLDRVLRHTVVKVYHLSTSVYIPNFMDGRTPRLGSQRLLC